MTPNHARLLAILTDLAERDEVCPTLLKLGEMAGISTSSVDIGLARLCGSGHIVMDVYHSFRIVQITATGKSTKAIPSKMRARPRLGPTIRTRVAANFAEPLPIETLTIPVSRDPCQRCGIPQFKGCAHFKPETVVIQI